MRKLEMNEVTSEVAELKFLNNKYSRWYKNIIVNARARILSSDSYVEKHHIIPKSLGGLDEQSNLVRLTAKEHFVCHLLLTKMVEGKNRAKMCYAVWQMTVNKHGKRYKITSRMYEILRKKLSDSYKGIPKTEEQKKKQSLAMTGKKLKPRTDEFKKYMSNLFIGKPKNYSSFGGKKHTEETLEKMSIRKIGVGNPMYGRKQTDEAVRKITEAQLGIPKPKFVCEHCGTIVGGKVNYLRWHGDNCKLKPL